MELKNSHVFKLVCDRKKFHCYHFYGGYVRKFMTEWGSDFILHLVGFALIRNKVTYKSNLKTSFKHWDRLFHLVYNSSLPLMYGNYVNSKPYLTKLSVEEVNSGTTEFEKKQMKNK